VDCKAEEVALEIILEVIWGVKTRNLAMPYAATTLTIQKSNFYVVCTIPAELREHFGGRKQIKRSAGTADLATAKRLQHGISAEIYESPSTTPRPSQEPPRPLWFAS
jgi:hypothetical protein